MKRPAFPAPGTIAPAAAYRPRGATPVGRVGELGALEATTLALLRIWLSGEPDVVEAEVIRRLGAADGREALAAFSGLLDALRCGPRPFRHHAAGCPCYGGDESAFIQLLDTASAGDEGAAQGFALHLFAGHAPPRLLGMAARAGLALRHMLATPRPPAVLH